MTDLASHQLWISLNVGTDILPLLVNLCSKECEENLPKPAKAYVAYAHKGGKKLQQPTYQEWEDLYVRKLTAEEIAKIYGDYTKSNDDETLS